MRVIAGKFGGQKLVAFKASHIRPTTDRVKETMFNMMGGDLTGQTVVDGFSGTGNLGIEALSRGAEQVWFVENHRKSLQILKQNLQKLKIREGFKIVPLSILSFLKKPEAVADIVIFDPPFTQKMSHEVMELASESSICGTDSRIYIESSTQEDLLSEYNQWHRVKLKPFGDKNLSIFARKELV